MTDPFESFSRHTGPSAAAPASRPPDDTFGQGPATQPFTEPGQPSSAASSAANQSPMYLLYLAAGSVAVALFALLFRSFVANVIGYLLATVVCITLVCLYRWVDQTRRLSSADYVSLPQAKLLTSIVLGAGMFVALPHVWAISAGMGR